MNEKVSIYISKKLIDDIKSFCKLNNKNYLEYITEILENQLSLDMYGDLNDKIKLKKRVPMKKVEEEKKENNVPIEPIAIDEPKPVIEPIIETIIKEDKPKTRRRTLNTK
jgi:hypothetical protein